jgi:CsoR family transcriptional regulator, copper-sensing transcriptional repressor
MAFRPKDKQERIIHRLKITKGHLEKVIKMVTDNGYCIDILHQLNAVECALKETQTIILENHLKTCAVDLVKEGKTNEAIDEIMSVFQKKK